MGMVKAIVKVLVLLAVGSAVAGAVMLVRRPKGTAQISFDDWPQVPQNPAA